MRLCPRTPPYQVRGRLCRSASPAPTLPHACGATVTRLGRSFITRRSAMRSSQAGRFPSRSIPERYRRSCLVSLRVSLGRPVVDLQVGRFFPISSQLPRVHSPELTLGRAASSFTPASPPFDSSSDCGRRRNGNTASWSRQQQGGNDGMATERTATAKEERT